MKQQVQCNRRADHFGNVAGDNADFRRQPQRNSNRAAVRIMACLR